MARLWKVLLSPEETFRAIAARPTWLLILVITLVASVGLWLVLAQKIDFVESMRQQMEAQGRELPSGAEKMAGVTKIVTIVFAGVAPLVLPLIVAGVLMALNLMGGRLRFSVSYSVLLHSGIPSLLKAILSLPVALGRASLTMQEAQMGLLKSSAAAFAPEGTGPRLMVLLSSLDVFGIWSLILMVIGYSVAARVSKATAAAFVLAGWILLLLVGVFFAGFRSA